jgi:hypothetical protein
MGRFWICLAALAGCAVADAADMTYNLLLDTSQMALTGSNYQFDFILKGTAGNAVTITSPNFGAGSLLPGQDVPIVLTSGLSNFGSSDIWQLTPGQLASFTLLTTDKRPLAGFSPDNVLIVLEDLNYNAFGTTDSDNALFRLALTGDADTPEVFPGTQPPILGDTFQIQGSVGTTGSNGGTGSAPEPATLGYWAIAGLIAICFTLLRRNLSVRANPGPAHLARPSASHFLRTNHAGARVADR